MGILRPGVDRRLRAPPGTPTYKRADRNSSNVRSTRAAARLWARRKSRSVWGATARSSLSEGLGGWRLRRQFSLMGQNATDMQNSGTGAEIAARPLVDKNADTNKPSGIAAAPCEWEYMK